MSEELGTIDEKASVPLALRDEDGTVRADYVERVAQAIEANSAALRDLVGDLHEADAGDLIEALDPELRPRLVELMGHDFDYSALTEVDDAVREEILESCRRRRAKACASSIPTTRSPFSRTCRRTSRPRSRAAAPSERVRLARSLLYPENSAGRIMQTEFIAVPPAWTVGRSSTMRETPICPIGSGSSTSSIPTSA